MSFPSAGVVLRSSAHSGPRYIYFKGKNILGFFKSITDRSYSKTTGG